MHGVRLPLMFPFDLNTGSMLPNGGYLLTKNVMRNLPRLRRFARIYRKRRIDGRNRRAIVIEGERHKLIQAWTEEGLKMSETQLAKHLGCVRHTACRMVWTYLIETGTF